MTVSSSYLDLIVLLPLVAGLVLFIVPDKLRLVKGIIAFLVSCLALCGAIFLYTQKDTASGLNLLHTGWLTQLFGEGLLPSVKQYTQLRADNMARLVNLLVCSYACIVLFFSLGYFSSSNRMEQYYPLVMLTLWASSVAVLADGMFLFLLAWGFLGLTLYKLIHIRDEESSAAAKKTFILIGASDGLMIIGIAIIWRISGSMNMSEISLAASDTIRNCAFLALLVGSFTKAGAFPFHSWVPDYTKKAPPPSSALLPASLDKLLGIYFMTRICGEMFRLNQGLILTILILGAITILTGGMMALIQDDFKRMLGYCAVSQVGYIIIGAGLGTTLGLIGALFHMLNHTLYKTGLFLVTGTVEKRTGKDVSVKRGGLSRLMPVTFTAALIFALSVSGIPPLNGFASKWVIYQAIIEFGQHAGLANNVWIVWLSVALLGSAITLAYMMKFISGIFFERSTSGETGKAAGVVLWLPTALLALLCAGIGIFATGFFIPKVIAPLAGDFQYFGIWDSSVISLLILVSIFIGVIIYLAGSRKKYRVSESFIGGETFRETASFPADGFYKTIQNAPVLSYIYKWAEKKYFDIYEIIKGIVLTISHFFSSVHNGILSNLAFWVLAGLIFMFIFLLM